MFCLQAVHKLEKTRQEQAVEEQTRFREAFLQAVAAEKEALLEIRKNSRVATPSASTRKGGSKSCNTGKGSLVERMQSKITSLQDELKAMRNDQKENHQDQLHSSMDQLSLQLQKLYTDAKVASKGKKYRECLVAAIRSLVQEAIFAA